MSLIGIELLTIDARIVIASVDTYLRFAEAVNRLDLTQTDDSDTLPELIDDLREGGATSKTKGAHRGREGEARHRRRRRRRDGNAGDSGSRRSTPVASSRRRKSNDD